MSLDAALIPLLALAFVIVVGPAIAVRLRLPAPVVLILAGVALGRSGIRLVGAHDAIGFLADLGFLVLMFVAGMEIDFASLRRAGARALVSPLATVAGIFAAAIAVGAVVGFGFVDMLVLSATSVGMPLAVLHDTGKLATPLGRYVLLTASIGEFVAIVAFTAFEVVAHEASTWGRLARAAKMVALFALCALLIRWARALVWWHPEPFARLVRHHDVAELGVRTGILLMLALVVLTTAFGVEAILGAFVAGALVSFVLYEKQALEGKIAALGQGLFIPVFFVVVGARFDRAQLDLTTVGGALAIVACAGLVKIVPAVIFAPRALRRSERLAAGSLLAAPLTLVVAIGAIGQELGLVSDRQQAGFVLVAIALSVLFPIGFRAFAGVNDAGKAATRDGSARFVEPPKRA